MDITKFAIDKNRITFIALLVILFSGISTYNNMPKAEDPGFIIRTAMVSAYFPGASPERMEMLVSDKLEKAIMEMPEIDFLSSESKTGITFLYVNIKESYTEMQPIWDKLRRKVDRARSDLPAGIIGPFVNDEFGDVFGTIITLTGEGYSYAELKEIADDARDELLLIEEVGKVNIFGAQDERIFVEYDNDRLSKLGLSASYLAQILASQNIIIPGGDIRTSTEKMVLEPTGNLRSLEELEQVLINLPGSNQVIALRDIAHIYRGYVDPPGAITTSSGISALALGINLREGGNILLLGEKVRGTIRRLQNVYPIGIDFEEVAFQADHVTKKVSDFSGNLIQAIGIVLLVMLIFLGIRTGLVVASLVPMAMVMSIWVMSFFDVGIDQMSLAALIIALGMLVDNAIVMTESIMVQMNSGKSVIEAAIDSAGELRIALLTSSLTTAAAFLPIYLAESATGEYTASLFKVVTITLLCSWVLSLTMIPLLAVKFLRNKKNASGEAFNSVFYRYYRSGLIYCLRHKILSMVVIFIVFFISMQGFGLIPNIFFPENDKAIYTAELEMPIGTPIERTREVVTALEKFMNEKLLASQAQDGEGIVNWSTYIGEGAPRFVLSFAPEPPNPAYAVMVVNTTSKEVIDKLIPATEAFCMEHFPDLMAEITRLPLGPPPDAPVAIRVSGKNLDKIYEIVDQIKAKMHQIKGTRFIRDDWGQRTKKLVVEINNARARRAGITNQDIAYSLQTALTGIETTQFREDDKIIPITLRSISADRQDLGKLESLNVYSQQSGRNVPLKQVADIRVVWEPAKILRRDGLKTVTVKCDVTHETMPIDVSLAMDEWLQGEKESWDPGYKYGLGGEMESSVKANESIAEKLPIALLIILLLLVSQFNSIRKPMIILLTIPLGIIGVVIGLITLQSYFGFMTLLGVISLAGVVINNAIVLLERIQLEMDENGLTPAQAIVESAQRRMRPILLTTATTIGGLIPLYFGGGPMWEPMAVAIMFGLAFATMLTLGFVPVLYAVFYKVSFKEFVYE